jgi:hypothetical protein
VLDSFDEDTASGRKAARFAAAWRPTGRSTFDRFAALAYRFLAREGHTKEALAKYNEAIKYASNWKQLSEVRETLAKKKV